MRIVDYLKNSELPLTADVVVYREGDLAVVKIRGSRERESSQIIAKHCNML